MSGEDRETSSAGGDQSSKGLPADGSRVAVEWWYLVAYCSPAAREVQWIGGARNEANMEEGEAFQNSVQPTFSNHPGSVTATSTEDRGHCNQRSSQPPADHQPGPAPGQGAIGPQRVTAQPCGTADQPLPQPVAAGAQSWPFPHRMGWLQGYWAILGVLELLLIKATYDGVWRN